MKTVCKKLLCLMLVAMLLVSAVPAAFAAEGDSAACSNPEHAGMQWTEKAEKHVDPTCTAAGKDVYYCGGGHEVTIEIPATGHSYVDDDIYPTCTVDGSDGKKCTGCGDRIVTHVWEANGHNFDGGNCLTCGAENPEKEDTNTANMVTFTIYEIDADNNATVFGTKTVDVNAYANEAALVKALYSGNYQKYTLRTERGTLHVWPNPDVQSVYQLKVMYNNGTSNYKLFDIYEGEGILAAIKNSGITPKYEDHVLVGYLKNHTGNSKTYLTIYDVASDANADANGVITVYADWREVTDDDDEDFEYGEGGGLYGDDNDDPIYDVVLYIYTNGKTSSPAKTVKASAMGRFTKDGILTDDEVQMVVENFFKTNSDTKYYGLFTKYYWNSGNYLTENAKYEIALDPDQTNYVYVMVKNAKAYVADSSNPKTGDTIMIAVTGMALAAAGLVSMIELKKRKMI